MLVYVFQSPRVTCGALVVFQFGVLAYLVFRLGAQAGLHPVFALILAIASFFAVTVGFLKNRLVFWGITGLAAILYGGTAAFLVHGLSQGDLIWTAFAALISAFFAFGLHAGAANGQ